MKKKIAQLIQLTEYKIQEQLYALHRLKVLEYLPQKANPQITFLTSRYLASELPLPIQKIEQKNKIAYQQIEAVIHYVTNNRHCRLATLLDYFDEARAICTQCDICKGKANPTLDPNDRVAHRKYRPSAKF